MNINTSLSCSEDISHIQTLVQALVPGSNNTIYKPVDLTITVVLTSATHASLWRWLGELGSDPWNTQSERMWWAASPTRAGR